MAGGEGSRLWPLSSARTPKYLLPLLGEGTLLAAAWRRALRLVGAGDVVTVTGAGQYPLVIAAAESQDPALRRHVISEPAPRDTAGAIAFAYAYLEARGDLAPDEELLVCPADHFLEPEEEFPKLVALAREPVRRGFLVTFGVRPGQEARTDYGYIRAGAEQGGFYVAEGFVEKPDLETARAYCASGRYFWNAGIFAFQAGVFRAAMGRHAPGFATVMDAGLKRARAMFGRLAPLSIDYALMEKAERVAIVPVAPPIYWSDAGTWGALREIWGKDPAGNAVRGEAVTSHETSNSLLFSSGRRLVVVGLDGVIVVETPEAVLVLAREHEQKARDIGRVSGEGKGSPGATKGGGGNGQGIDRLPQPGRKHAVHGRKGRRRRALRRRGGGARPGRGHEGRAAGRL